MRALKIIIYTLFTLVILAVIAAIVFVTTINPNDYKAQISAFVYKQTGQQLTIKGDISLSIFPWLGVRIHDASLSNPDGFIAKSLIDMGEADVKVNLMPLLQEKIEVQDITLKSVTINLQRQQNGITNLDNLMKQYHVTYSAAAAQEYAQATGDKTNLQSEVASTVNNKISQAESGFSAAVAGLAISNVEIDNANLNWIDQQNNQNISLKNLNFSTQNFSLNKSFPVNLSFELDQAAPQKRTLSLSLTSNVQLNLSANTYQFNNLSMNGQFTQDPWNIPFKFSTNALLNLKDQSISLSALNAQMNDLVATGNIDVTQLTTTPTLKGNLDVPAFSSDALKQFVPANTKLPKSIEAHLSFQASPTYVKVPQLKLILDDSTLDGQFNYANFPGQPQDISFTLNANKFNVNNYLPAQAAASGANSAASNDAGYSHAPILPLGLLKSLQVNGSLKVGQVTYQNVEMDNVNFNIKTNNQVFDSSLSTQIMKAEIAVQNHFDISGATPSMSTNVNANQIDIKPVMSLVTKHAFLKGTGTFNGTFNMRGNDVYSWVNSLSGNGKFALHQGAIDGVDVAYYIDLAKALLNKQLSTPTPNTKQTPFDQFSASFTIQNGVFTNHDLVVSSGHLTANGNGQVSLPAQNINYKMVLNLGSNIQVPLKITGPLNNPSEALDMQALLKQQINKQVNQVKQKATQQITNTVKQQANELAKKINLGKLFG